MLSLSRAAVGVSLMAAQRLVELAHARRNERAARARGAVEVGARHYPLIVAVHVTWLAATLVEGRHSVRLRRLPLGVLALAQGLRYWAIWSLGPQWTTRVLVDRSAEPVTTGPYRFTPHPNYLAVAAEIAAFPLVFDARRTAVTMSLVNGAVLRHRIAVESSARGPAHLADLRPLRPADTDGDHRRVLAVVRYLARRG